MKRRTTFAPITNEYLDLGKNQLDEQYCNRLYQLINCLIIQAVKQKKE